jgi:predicted transcriptional regulator
MNDHATPSIILELTAHIVSAYVANNALNPLELPKLIHHVHDALTNFKPVQVVEESAEPAKPAVSVKKSITPDYLICLEDGKKFKSLKRHLRSHYGLSPDDYREKWGLPPDYPMVAPNYATTRSALAKEMGLGQSRRTKRK